MRTLWHHIQGALPPSASAAATVQVPRGAEPFAVASSAGLPDEEVSRPTVSWRARTLLLAAGLMACSPRADAAPAEPPPVGVTTPGSAQEAPGTAPEDEEVREVSLRELTPQPPAGGPAPPTTALIHARREPPGGERERSGEVSVVSRCVQGGSCFDGLRDARTGKLLISPAPTRDEQETLAAPGAVQRLVRLVSVSDVFISVYLGSTTFSEGAAHANNSLACATFSRRTGRRLALSDVVSRPRAKALQRQASQLLEEDAERHGLGPGSLHPRNFLYDASARRVSLCATPTATWAGGSVLVVTPPDASPQ